MIIKFSPKFQTLNLFEIDLLLGFQLKIFQVTGRMFKFYDEIGSTNTTSLFYISFEKYNSGEGIKYRLDFWDLFFWRGIKHMLEDYRDEKSYYEKYVKPYEEKINDKV